jgi:PAS domain S-box-containing protein
MMRNNAGDRERRRVEALESYGMLDTPPEQDFDNIVKLAADICGTPIAVVNFIGEKRQFFKAEVGLGVRETPLETSFCARAILEEDFLMVPDATADPRFSCNPLVTGQPFIRFYAGAQLKTPDQQPIGTLCVLAFQPMALSAFQQSVLKTLAAQVMALLEMRRQIGELRYDLRVERRLASKRRVHARQQNDARTRTLQKEQDLTDAAHDAGRIGIFEIDVQTSMMTVSREYCRIFGLAEQRHYKAGVIEDLILDEDRIFASRAESRVNASAPLDVEYRIRRHNDDRIRWINRRAHFLENETGQTAKMVGIALDITDSKRKEERVEALLRLGDQLRSARSLADITAAAADTLIAGLGADRAGYASLDLRNASFRVEHDHSAGDLGSWAGQHSTQAISQTIDRLSTGAIQPVSSLSVAWLHQDQAWYRNAGVHAFINVPILESERISGFLFIHSASQRFWDKHDLDFAAGVADRTYAALAQLRAEAEQRLLNHELSHRLKNTLSIVQAIITQTLRRVGDQAAVAALTGRIQALGSAHDVLLQQSWSSASIHDVITRVMKLHADDARVVLSGPDVPLGPKAGLSISLLLHELGTNAIKYGALSGDRGYVSISWEIISGLQGDDQIRLTWAEKNGPVIAPPVREGFGSRLIEMGISGAGETLRTYEPSGLVATFTAPLLLITQSD